MLRTYFSLLTLFLFSILNAQTSGYKVEINLDKTANDQVPVTVYPPASDSAFIEYHMAKIVPGTYDISDFGRFVTDFVALDTLGDTLAVEQLDVNRWQIENRGLHQISYKVHDSWDTFEGYSAGDNFIFEPGGTNINREGNAYVINTFGFVGYVDDFQFNPYEVHITRSDSLYGATALARKESSEPNTDIFVAEDFNYLADGPILYSVPDTVTRKIGNTEVIVSVYSPNNMLTAEQVMDNIDDLMLAQAEYLGGKLPVERYAYLIYLNEKPTLSGALGALEHSYSSLYSFPEISADYISKTVRDVAAHEFFHIVTPLNIHSEEIGRFDFIDPKMSEHLWLYEGVTEYSSMHVQVKYDLFSEEQFLDEIREKLLDAEQYPSDVSFTHMSENILEEPYASMYGNVYAKGALIAMCLDLYIIKHSDGEKDLQWLLRELAKKYGKDVSFEDEKLFQVIEDLTYPEVGAFLETYVGGNEPLPVTEILSWAGINYSEKEMNEVLALGFSGLILNDNQEIVVSQVADDAFAEDLKIQEGDILLELNEEPFTLSTAQDLMSSFKEETEPGDKVKMVVMREKKNGKLKRKKLKAKAILVEKEAKHVLDFKENPSEEQMNIREAWLQADE